MRLLPAAYELPEPIRPRRCPFHEGALPASKSQAKRFTAQDRCDGLGFLYPDPPDWWLEWEWPGASAGQFIPSWRLWCDVTWRVLGVTDDG